MSNPFSNPAAASGIQWEHLLGHLLLIEPSAVEKEIVTTFGAKEAVRADVTDLGDGAASTVEEYPDALIFPGVLISQTRSLIGEKVLGRLAQGTAKPGQKPPWRLDDATDADIAAGVKYLDSRTKANPFTPAASAQTAPPF
jgi:hypothetical protein